MMRDMPKIAAPTAYLDRDNLSDEKSGLQIRRAAARRDPRAGARDGAGLHHGARRGRLDRRARAPDCYYGRIREICDEFGILLIYDEVMTGAGRTGRFLAAEHWGITPDLIALSKGFGGGYVPLGAMVARGDMVEAVLDAGGFLHGFTSAGNPLSCAAGLAVLNEIERLDLIGNAARMGDILKDRLTA
jgi:hypothetical protein